MSSSKKITITNSSRSGDYGHAYYKSTRTVTDANGNKHTDTVEMFDDDTINFLGDSHVNRNNAPRFDGFEFRPNISPRNSPRSEQHSYQIMHFPEPTPNSPPSSSSSTRTATPSGRVEASESSANGHNNNDFYQEALQVHNELRQRHGVEPLRMNKDLCKLAQKWADHLASTGRFEHSRTQYRNVKVGENLASQSWSPMTGKEMTQRWYDEIDKYNYRNPTFQSGTGHFTQVVWKGSEEVGFAQAKGASMTIGVAMYYPPGNYKGEFDRNVLPPQ